MKLSELLKAKADPKKHPLSSFEELRTKLDGTTFEELPWKEKVLYLCTLLHYLEEKKPPIEDLISMRQDDQFCHEAKLIFGIHLEKALKPLIAAAQQGTSGALKIYALDEQFPQEYFIEKAKLASPNPYDASDQRLDYDYSTATELSRGSKLLLVNELLPWVGASQTLSFIFLSWWEQKVFEATDINNLPLHSLNINIVDMKPAEKKFLTTLQVILLIRYEDLIREKIIWEDDFETYAEQSMTLAPLLLYNLDLYREEKTGVEV